MELVEYKENPFPESLEGRMNAMLNVVNTELKTATVMHLDDTPAEKDEIKARIRESVGGDCYLPQTASFRDYCHHTLFPIGMVAEEMIRRETIEAVYPAWKLTDAGRDYGRPCAVMALEFAVDNDISLYNILGNTSSKGKTRSPLNKIKILKALARGGEMNVNSISRLTDLYPTSVLKSLKSFEKIDYVRFDSLGEAKKDESLMTYRWVSGRKVEDVQQVDNMRNLTKRVSELLRNRKTMTLAGAKNDLDASYSGLLKVTLGLVRQGFAERTGGYGPEKKTRVTLKDDALKFLEFVERTEDLLLSRCSANDREQIYLDFVNDEDRSSHYLRTAIGLYRNASPNINRRPIEETNDAIIDFLRRNPGARARDIFEHFNLSSGTHLSNLFKAKSLRKVKDGKEARYFVNE